MPNGIPNGLAAAAVMLNLLFLFKKVEIDPCVKPLHRLTQPCHLRYVASILPAPELLYPRVAFCILCMRGGVPATLGLEEQRVLTLSPPLRSSQKPAAAKKSPVKKTIAKKPPAKKSPAKKSAAKKPAAAKKSPAKKAVKKSPAKKVVKKKSAAKK